jgi:hypothetical protein
VRYLDTVLHALRAQGMDRIVYFAGDSSLDNKYWLLSDEREPAVNGYEYVLDPPECVPDVCFWLNKQLSQDRRTPNTAALMTSIEATTLGQRISDGLLPQDEFVRDHIQPEDYLVVSVGGNDIALAPTTMTTVHLGSLLLLPAWSMKSNPSFNYFVRMFRDQVQEYIQNLTASHRPRKILVCMIYFPCTTVDSVSWSQRLLSITGYDRNPAHLQAIIREIFLAATSQIRIEGSEVIPIPLFDVLDADNAAHYVQRVEPSSAGGALMAAEFIKHFD